MTYTEKDVLLKEYRDMVAGYVRILKQLKRATPAAPEMDFETLSAEAKDCMEKCKAAQRVLQQHVATHRC